MVRNVRENFILSGMICIAFGAFLTIGGVLSMGAVIGISGVLLFIIGMSTPSNRTLAPAEIAAWKPSAEQLPDANRIMYRVDVTIDEPKKQRFSVDHVELLPNLTEIVQRNSPAHHATSSCMRTKKNNHFCSNSYPSWVVC